MKWSTIEHHFNFSFFFINLIMLCLIYSYVNQHKPNNNITFISIGIKTPTCLFYIVKPGQALDYYHQPFFELKARTV